MTWKNMIQRCANPANPAWEDYGGRGIKVCDRWLKSFEDFAHDIGNPPSNNHSIDRINVNGNYEPGNVRWATDSEQARNKRNTVMVIHNNAPKCLRDLCDEVGINYFNAYHRMVRLGRESNAVISELKNISI